MLPARPVRCFHSASTSRAGSTRGGDATTMRLRASTPTSPCAWSAPTRATSVGVRPNGRPVSRVNRVTQADAAARRRRREAPRKGDLREQAILDAAEALLESETLDTLTVEAIARGAGITRNALYFYFASKQD